MQLAVPTMLQSFSLATVVAEGDALWHSTLSGGHCPGLASLEGVSGEESAAKLIVFPEWDNLVQYGGSVTMADLLFVSIN
ncbi:hypothetical protein H4S14_002372 [Agrobacterium vitis]|nr:hypothetical protein [Agrobacterium vitis]MBE1438622.1 hypothetical protein [Agrobacterium vitis]